jgi:hypothetical protein
LQLRYHAWMAGSSSVGSRNYENSRASSPVSFDRGVRHSAAPDRHRGRALFDSRTHGRGDRKCTRWGDTHVGRTRCGPPSRQTECCRSKHFEARLQTRSSERATTVLPVADPHRYTFSEHGVFDRSPGKRFRTGKAGGAGSTRQVRRHGLPCLQMPIGRRLSQLTFIIASSRLDSRIGQHLNPVQAALRSSTRRIGDSHLCEPRIHDVLAMPGTLEPASHHFVGRFGAVGNILTH